MEFSVFSRQWRPDQTLPFVASGLGLHMSHKKEVRLIWVNI